MQHEIPHDLSVKEAQAVARQAIDSYAQRFAKYSPEIEWRDASAVNVAFTAKGVRLQGAFKVEPDRFRMELDVPFLLRPFQSKALKVIDREVQHWVAKAKSGQAGT